MSESGKQNGLSIGIENLVIRFGDFEALHSTTLNIRNGELFTLLGPSGCGKTTLLRCLAGFIKPSEGRVKFDGRDVSRIEPWDRGIGFVFQNYALWPTKRIAKNVAYGLEMRGIARDEIDQRVRDTLDLVELSSAAAQYPGELSGGMQQRAALARALIIDPPLLLLDEPLSNLDAKLRVKLRRDIRDLQSRLGLTAVYVTHDQEEALDISDRIAVMRQGEVMQVGTPTEIYEQPQNAEVADFVGKSTFLSGQALDTCQFRLDDGTVIRGKYAFESTPERGKVMFTRPEDISFGEAGAGQITGQIKEVSYLGNLTRCVVELGSDQSAMVETRRPARVGEIVGLQFSQMHVFDEMPQSRKESGTEL